MSADAEDAECLLTARRDNYVARTFSHMARARLDHAVSRSADLELLESEKWEMRYACHLCSSLSRITKLKHNKGYSQCILAQCGVFHQGVSFSGLHLWRQEAFAI